MIAFSTVILMNILTHTSHSNTGGGGGDDDCRDKGNGDGKKEIELWKGNVKNSAKDAQY